MRDFITGVLGGAALIMFGVEVMGGALERLAGEGLRRALAALTGTVGRAFVAGTGLTALVQNSTAVTVLTVGFVHAGLLPLASAVGIVYGANLGTTATAQLMAFEITDYALLLVAVGFLLRSAAGRRPEGEAGLAVLGLGIAFLGLKVLHGGVGFIRDSETTRQVFLRMSGSPIGAILAGMVATMLVHSSSATIGLAMVLARAGMIDLTAAIALMLGDNIGTCITAQIASLGRSAGARRTAWAHTLFNISTVLMAVVLLPALVSVVKVSAPEIGRQIANAHTLFNLLGALVFLPLTGRFVKLLIWLVPE